MTRRGDDKTREPAILISDADGRIIDQNTRARELLGEALGAPCCDGVGDATTGSKPCRQGCAQRVLAAADQSSEAPIRIGQALYQLTCTPVGTTRVTTLEPIDVAEQDSNDRRLSSRELQVLQLLARGASLPNIAEALELKLSTVRTHVEHLRSKLGVSSQAALVAQGYERGYLGGASG